MPMHHCDRPFDMTGLSSLKRCLCHTFAHQIWDRKRHEAHRLRQSSLELGNENAVPPAWQNSLMDEPDDEACLVKVDC